VSRVALLSAHAGVHGKGHAVPRGEQAAVAQNVTLVLIERIPLAVLGAVVGWSLGWLSAWATEWLEYWEWAKDPAEPATLEETPRASEAEGSEKAVAERRERPALGKVWRDPLMQGGCALVWAAAALLPTGDWWRPWAVGLLAVPLVQVAVTDFRTRYVYTLYAAVGIGLGLGLGWLVHDAPWWTSVAGAIGGTVSFGLLYVLGRLVFRREAMASGDITIAAMVGAGAATCTLQALVYGVLVGGVIAAGTLAFRRQLGIFMPYGPGLCLGGLAILFWC
jgi:prepilin signal peptidase PulO-like enzyme (type II secretory pathway)